MAGRPENLRPPWQPGKSANPGGRPKRKPISDQYAKLADMALPDDLRRKLKMKEGSTFGQAVAYRIFMKAMTGNSPAAKELREAIEGRAPQAIQLTDPDGNALPQAPERLPLTDVEMAAVMTVQKLLAKKEDDPPRGG